MNKMYMIYTTDLVGGGILYKDGIYFIMRIFTKTDLEIFIRVYQN